MIRNDEQNNDTIRQRQQQKASKIDNVATVGIAIARGAHLVTTTLITIHQRHDKNDTTLMLCNHITLPPAAAQMKLPNTIQRVRTIINTSHPAASCLSQIYSDNIMILYCAKGKRIKQGLLSSLAQRDETRRIPISRAGLISFHERKSFVAYPWTWYG